MAVKIKFDRSHTVIEPTFVLATRGGHKLGVIPATSVTISDAFNDKFDLQFKVHKTDNGTECPLWDQITDFKLVWCEEWDVWFEMYVEIEQSNVITKTVTCASLGEAELSQINLYNIEINTEDDIARDDYQVTVLYDSDNPEGSLLNRIMEKAPHYTIKHVDASIAGIQRTFSFDDTSIYDAFQDIAEEIDCIFVIDSGTNEDGTISRSISVYDLESYCMDCGKRDNFIGSCPSCGGTNILPGYGDDTTIFISDENLADAITRTTDTDSVKNCFRLEGGDDLMTATLINCNPNGSQYIWYFTDYMKEDMSDELVAKINEYEKLYDYYQNTYIATVPVSTRNSYNTLVEKYHNYNSDIHTVPETAVGYSPLMNVYYDTVDFYLFLNDTFMPSVETSTTNATKEASKLSAATLSPVAVQSLSVASEATVANTVLSMARVLVDQRFGVKVKDSAYSGNVWTGTFTVTNYSDEDDVATTASMNITVNEDYETFTKQKIDRALNTQIASETVTDAVSLFDLSEDEFKAEIKKYSLVSLETFIECAQTCLDVLIEQGVADKDSDSWSGSALYDSLYLPYYNKMQMVQSEAKLREEEIAVIREMQDFVDDERTAISDALDIEAFFGDDLWNELSSYRREDTYQNENYISDGLDNAELFKRAQEFVEIAEKEIYKSANLQHSITSDLKNLLTIKEFAPIVDNFSVGNWLRVKIDGEVYRLRLIYYEIDFDDLNNISVEFSDVKQVVNGVTDSADVLGQAVSMATTYDSVKRQAKKGKLSKDQLSEWVDKGLALTQLKIISNADNQNITWDSHGLLCREYLIESDTYSDKQLKIINKGLYLTDDNWLTARAGIGNFMFWNPDTGKTEEAYGVIADTLVGNLILGKKVGIYNTENSIVLSENGLVITTNTEGKNMFTIQKETTDSDGNVTYEKQLYINDNGDITLSGDAKISWENISGAGDVATKETLDALKETFSKQISELTTQIDGKIETYKQADDPSANWADDEKAKHDGDLWYNTTEEKSYIYNGSSWEEMKTEPPQTVYDSIDGKAQIFGSTPTTPYNVGDLYFTGTDILICVTARKSGDYSADDWTKKDNYTDDSALTTFMNGTYSTTLNEIKSQVDAKAETWKQADDPSTAWTTTALKASHKGDLWYNTTEGKSYIYSGTAWEVMKTEPPQSVYDSIDGKAQIFSSTPTTPYNVGDLYFTGTDIMVCKTARSSGSYSAEDWEKKDNYTDDSSLTDFINNTYTKKIDYLTGQIDGKVESWNQSSDPSTAWTTDDLKTTHKGDIWVNSGIAKIWNGSDWESLSTTDIPDELIDKIDGKCNVFTETPTPPYETGDLWVQGSNGDILKCKTAKASGESYSAEDWEKASKYTDDSKAKSYYDELSNILGYDGTTITGTYIYSPHISGGDITIGSASSGVMAKIDSTGALTATGATINGTITANYGKIGPWNITSSSIWYGSSSYQSSGGMYFGTSGLSISSNFRVDTEGNLSSFGVTACKAIWCGYWGISNQKIICYSNSLGQQYIYPSAGTEIASYSATEIYLSNFRVTSGGGVTCNSLTVQNSGMATMPYCKAGMIIGNSDSYGTVILATSETNTSYRLYFGCTSSSKNFYPYNASTYLGTVGSNYVGYWKGIYAQSASITTSDRNFKTDISTYTEDLENAYMEFEPVSFKFKNLSEDDNHDRTHYGLIAQQVEEVLIDHGISIEDAAFICKDELESPNKFGETVQYSMRYGELVSINMHMIQKAHQRIDELEAQLKEALETIAALKSKAA